MVAILAQNGEIFNEHSHGCGLTAVRHLGIDCSVSSSFLMVFLGKLRDESEQRQAH
jgi:hypothetical protein